jgi:flagellar export protein FliJ
MTALDSLIRIHRWQVDERRQQLAQLDALAAKLGDEQRRLEEEARHEQTTAGATPEGAFAYGSYAGALAERRRTLARSLAEVEQQLVKAREALAEAFQEMKRYEITAANRERQQREKVARRQQAALDDIGLETYRRRSAGRA